MPDKAKKLPLVSCTSENKSRGTLIAATPDQVLDSQSYCSAEARMLPSLLTPPAIGATRQINHLQEAPICCQSTICRPGVRHRVEELCTGQDTIFIHASSHSNIRASQADHSEGASGCVKAAGRAPGVDASIEKLCRSRGAIIAFVHIQAF